MKIKLFENPLTISLILYIIISLIIYIRNPNLFDKNKDNDDEDSFVSRYACFIFILCPILIYGCICGLTSYTNRTHYCKLLKSKELNLKEMLEQCKK